MSHVKISQLPTAIKTTPNDQFMIIQGDSNKKLTLQTLLSKLDSPVTINSQRAVLNFVVNGTQSNLIYTDAATNAVGILTNTPQNAALQVLGDIRVGGTTSISRKILSIAAGANNSGGTGYRTITINIPPTQEAITGIFSAEDTIVMSGLTPTTLNGYKVIGANGTHSFKFNVLNTLDISGLVTLPLNANAQKITFKQGVFKSSIEQVIHNSSGGTKTISASYSITGLTVNGPSDFSLASTGGEGQEKYIYLKSIASVGDKATISNINGIGFNRIQLTKVGDAVSLSYDGSSWVCLGVNGATISAV